MGIGYTEVAYFWILINHGSFDLLKSNKLEIKGGLLSEDLMVFNNLQTIEQKSLVFYIYLIRTIIWTVISLKSFEICC